MKSDYILSAIAAIGMLLSSCSQTSLESETIEVTGISLSGTEMTILLDEEKTLTATVTPSDATSPSVRWTSSDEKVATVSGGKVKGVSEGTATITATAGEFSATCNVTVRRPSLVVTGDVVGVSYYTADLAMRIFFEYADKGAKFEDAGIVYSKDPAPVLGTDMSFGITRDKEGNPDMSGSYTISLYNLEESTTYYYQAFACFDGVNHFGEVRSFKTTAFNIATTQLVDMGLSVKWAGWNIGATKPEELGDLFVWGNVEPATSAYWYNSRWINGNQELTKYNTDASLGIVDNKKVLDLEDDAAAVNWEGKWRMPTDEEKRELESNTLQTKTVYKGVPGYVFTSMVNGASIFFPAAGYMYQSKERKHVGDYTTFWTSSIHEQYPSYSYFACDHVYEGNSFVSEGSMLYDLGFYWDCATSNHQHAVRWYAFSVRGVWDEERADITFTPEIIIEYATDETATTVRLHGRITNFFCNGRTAANLPEFGFCLREGLGVSPTVNDIKINCSASDGAQDGYDFVYSKDVTGLKGSTDYAYAAYAMFGDTPSYASGYKFTTLTDYSSIDPSMQAVDLGLSVKWAGWNVGATKPEEAGGHYQWADYVDIGLPTYSSTDGYVSTPYKWYDTSEEKFTKYVLAVESQFGTAVDDLKVLQPEDDAATVLWGSDWRTPTMAEWNELKMNCIFDNVEYNGVNGIMVTGPNGNSIFLPFAYTSTTNNNVKGAYWSANLREDIAPTYTYYSALILSKAYSARLWNVYGKGNSMMIDLTAWNDRREGISVRAVTDR